MLRSGLRWAPKVEAEKIRHLYASEAGCQLDEESLDDVFIGLYLRGKSILQVTAATEGRVHCQQCGFLITRTEMLLGSQRENEIIHCPVCEWEVNWEQFYRSYKGKQLFARNALPAITAFVDGFDCAESSRDKLMLIDRLIHAFHNELLERPNRPVAINFIAGRWQDVVTLILDLAYGDDPVMNETRLYWQQKLPASTLPFEH